jgi:hypothetical protein
LPAPSAPRTCDHRIRLTAVRPETPTCQVFGLRANMEAVLHVPCSGDGPADVTFENFTFTGAMTNGTLLVRNEHDEEIGDGCSWRFFQEIEGPIEHLRFAYRERIVGGTGCYRPCGAEGDFETQRQSSM